MINFFHTQAVRPDVIKAFSSQKALHVRRSKELYPPRLTGA
jgi:hypothetical protein